MRLALLQINCFFGFFFLLSPDFHELWRNHNDCLLQKLWHGHNDCRLQKLSGDGLH